MGVTQVAHRSCRHVHCVIGGMNGLCAVIVVRTVDRNTAGIVMVVVRRIVIGVSLLLLRLARVIVSRRRGIDGVGLIVHVRGILGHCEGRQDQRRNQHADQGACASEFSP